MDDRVVRLDFSHVEASIDYLAAGGDSGMLAKVADLPATRHLMGHARFFMQDYPLNCPEDFVRTLLSPVEALACTIEEVQEVIQQVGSELTLHSGWEQDFLSYLPPGFHPSGTLFFTFGYDIGVAFQDNASVNLAHPHFRRHPGEVLYFCVHEMHHSGFFRYNAPPNPADVLTCRDMLHLIRYLTHLEGMAVWAVYPRRRANGTLPNCWSGDYAALDDQTVVDSLSAEYWGLYRQMESMAEEAITPVKFESVIETMAGRRRLWYRVGCHMARTIESRLGREELVHTVLDGPESFFARFGALEG